MDFTSNVAIAVYAFLAVVTVIAAAWWRFIESPDRQRDQARHAASYHAKVSVQEYANHVRQAAASWPDYVDPVFVTTFESQGSTEADLDYAYAEYLHSVNAGMAADPMSGWEASVTRWETEQAMWRDALSDGPDAVWDYLAAGVLRDTPWVRS